MSEDLEKKLLVDKRTLKDVINELKQWSAPATVLLSLYVPPGRPVSDVVQMLREELSLADNIKLKRTRNAVKRAIAAAIDRLTAIPRFLPTVSSPSAAKTSTRGTSSVTCSLPLTRCPCSTIGLTRGS